MPHRIGIINRGEAAARCLAAVDEMGEVDGKPLEAVLLYVEADAVASLVLNATRARCIGETRDAYLDPAAVVQGLRASGCTAAWLGWGFASESAGMVAALEAAGVTVLGPRAQTIARVGDKIAAKTLAESLGIPVCPWSAFGPRDAAGDMAAACAAVGYPLLLKASGGGGGRGIRRVDGPEALPAALEAATREAGASFGDSRIFVERELAPVRHVEVQIFGDGAGRVRVFGVRDCSVQRRRQKILEECPAPRMPGSLQSRMEDAARRLGEAVEYRSAGTVEFLFCPKTSAFYFMEINARLQVEHTITEEVFGIDLVRMQIELALAGRFPAVAEGPRGWAFEARVCAEDPARGFMPAPGRLVRFTPPAGPGIRVDTGFREGDVISAAFDSMIAKVIARGASRRVALRRLTRALGDMVVLVEGGTSNLSCLRRLTQVSALVEGRHDTGVLALLDGGEPPGRGVAALAALVDEAAHTPRGTGGHHRSEAFGGVDVFQVAPHGFVVARRARWLFATYRVLTPVRGCLSIDGRAFDVRRVPGSDLYEVDGVTHRVETAVPGTICAPCDALVVDVRCAPGATVASGEILAVIESMKMEMTLSSPAAGRVRSVDVEVGRAVKAGQRIAVVASGGPGPSGEVLDDLPWREAVVEPAMAELLLHGSLTGWDDATERLGWRGSAVRAEGLPRLLEIFADVAELFERRPRRGADALDRVSGGAVSLTPRLWLDSLEARGSSSLPASLRVMVERVVRHWSDDTAEGRAHDGVRLRRLADRLPRFTVHVAACLEAAEHVPLPLLDRLARLDPGLFEHVRLAASRARWRIFEDPAHAALRHEAARTAAEVLARLEAGEADWPELLAVPMSLVPALTKAAVAGSQLAAQAVARRLAWSSEARATEVPSRRGHVELLEGDERCIVTIGRGDEVLDVFAQTLARPAQRRLLVTEVEADGAWHHIVDGLVAVMSARGRAATEGVTCLVGIDARGPARPRVRWFDRGGRPLVEREGILPTTWRRFGLARYRHFDLARLHGDDDITVFRASARANGRDVRLIAFGEVRSLARSGSRPVHLLDVERVFHAAVRAMHAVRAQVDPRGRGQFNAIVLRVLPAVRIGAEALRRYAERLAPEARGLGIHKVVLRGRFEGLDDDAVSDLVISIVGGRMLDLDLRPASDAPERPLGPVDLAVALCRRRGLYHPVDVLGLLEGDALGPPGRFVEYDLGPRGLLVPVVGRPRGDHGCGVVVGVVSTPCAGGSWERVVLMSDPSRHMGAVAEPECRRIIAALALARARDLPVEWVATSAGARIDFETGTENLDWVAEVLAQIVRFTQDGGEIHVIAVGPCVGGQAYWIAEATMMMHTRGLLVMTDAASIVLTGKRALDASGCVSAADNLSLGGFAHVMGPNGQAQLCAADLAGAYALLYTYYRNAGCGPPAWVVTADPIDRDISVAAYPAEAGHGFARIGDIFDDRLNPGRKRPFAVRPVMAALADADALSLERWRAWHGAESIAVWETRLGGRSVTLIGVDNQPLPRYGRPDGEGPDSLAGGTLYPQCARKIARALNAASGRRPVVVLANLSGFDGSPRSLREWQLEYGAEIGRAVVNFVGRIVFVVLSRYHGGAYVVFSRRLNPELVAGAVHGSFASVIGGAPAARVVFAGEVARLAEVAGGDERARRQAIAEVAARFDAVHTVERARQVGSLDDLVDARELRPYVIGRLRDRPAAAGGTHGAFSPDHPGVCLA